MKYGTVSAGIFSYSRTKCNAHGCTTALHRGLLCKHHWDRYATNDQFVELLTNIETINFGTPSPELLKTVAKNHRKHNLTGQPTPYVEHFPLESLFHAVRRHALSDQRPSKEDAVISTARRVKALIEDFGWARNEWLAELRLQYAELTGDLSTLYHSDTSIGPRALAFFPLGPERMWVYATILFTLLLLTHALKPPSEFGFFVPWGASPQKLLILYVSYVGVVVFGLFVFQRIDAVGRRAGKHRLYLEPYASKAALLTFAKIRARFDSRSDLDYGTMGSSTMFAFLVAGGVAWDHWEWSSKAFAVMAEALLLLPCIYSTIMIYNVYANASVALSELPSAEFIVDPASEDGRFGVADLADLLLFVLIFNCSLLVLVSFVVPLLAIQSYWWFGGYMLLTSPIMYFRIVQIRKAWLLRSALLLSVRPKLGSAPRALTDRRPSFLLLLLSTQARRRLEFLAATVVLPLLLMIGDKYYKDVTAWFTAIAR